MIKKLKLKNFILFDDTEIDFVRHTNSLVGESGAGKSLVFKAINVLSGTRNDKSLIMKNKDYYELELIYDTSNLAVDLKSRIEEVLNEELFDELILYRRLNADGRSQIRINGVLVTLSDSKTIMSELIDIHEQNSSDEILKQNNQNDLIDKLIEQELLNEYRNEYKIYKTLFDKKNELEQKIETLDDDLEILNFKIDKLKEIQNVEPEEVLEEKVNNVKDIAKQNEIFAKLKTATNQSSSNIEELHNLSIDSNLEEDLKTKISTIYDLMEELNYEIARRDSSVDIESIDTLMDQLTQIKRLKRKYNLDYEGLVNKYTELLNERDELTNIDNELININTKYLKQKQLVENIADKLSAKRLQVISYLETEINKNLEYLNMQEAEIKFAIETTPLTSHGVEEINFLIRTNKGYDFAPLSEIASGGEKSRIMLIIKKVFSKADENKVLLLDEIDQGVSSVTAQKIGEMINEMAEIVQIILISHTPQVLAKVNNLIEIKKNNEYEQTYSTAKTLNENETEQIISKMVQL